MAEYGSSVLDLAQIALRNRDKFQEGYEQTKNISDAGEALRNIANNEQNWLCESLVSQGVGAIVGLLMRQMALKEVVTQGLDDAEFGKYVCDGLDYFEKHLLTSQGVRDIWFSELN